MISLTAVAAGAAIVSAVIFGWQLRLMQSQLDTMQAQSRPWMSVEHIDPQSAFMGMSVTKDGGIQFLPEVTVKNVGQSVGIGVSVFYKIIFQPQQIKSYYDFFYIQRTENNFCDSMRVPYDPRVFGDAIFPNASKQLDAPDPDNLDISADQLKKYARVVGGTKYVQLILIGCVQYRFYAYPKPFQTRFAYTIGVRGLMSDAVPLGKDIPADKLIFVPYWFGNGYAD